MFMHLKTLVISILAMTMASRVGAFTAQSQEPHQIAILNYGKIALAERIKLVESAQQRISLESFSFDIGPSTRLLLQAILKKAKNGVKVEITLDKFGTDRSELSALQLFAKSNNIDLRVFNTSKDIGFRTHRKILIVDESRAIVGGRNLQDQQYENLKEVQAIDREVLIEGPIVKDIQKSFDLVFNGKHTNRDYKNRKREEELEKIKSWFVETEADQSYKKKIQLMLSKDVPESRHAIRGICQSITWSTSTDKETFEDPQKTIYSRLSSASSKVQIESPYFIPSKKQKKLLTELMDRNIELEFLTNGALSSFEFHISLANYDAIKFQKKGLNVRFLDGTLPFNRREKEIEVWRLHAKTYIVDSEKFAITSFNWDRRSETINLETALTCDESSDLVANLSDYMSRQFNGQGTTQDFFKNYSKSKALFFIERMVINPFKPLF
ncbi:MAG: cardiolipin synthase ClsC [Bdellovibrio sp.]